jgi:hypothetical protein
VLWSFKIAIDYDHWTKTFIPLQIVGKLQFRRQDTRRQSASNQPLFVPDASIDMEAQDSSGGGAQNTLPAELIATKAELHAEKSDG